AGDGGPPPPAATAGLVLGAKRLVAGKEWEKSQKLMATHRRTFDKSEQFEQIEVLNRIPAELMVCRLLQRFREATHSWPRALAVTYPTTYSPRELEQLREVVQRAWLRMQSRLQMLEFANDEAPDPDPELDRYCRTLQQLIHQRPTRTQPGDHPLIRLLADDASAAAVLLPDRR